MAYLLGTDEAGYGPNLGPLVISATLWHLPDKLLKQDLYDVLSEVVSRTPCSEQQRMRLTIADSKLLYKPGGGLGALEQVLHATSLSCPVPGSDRMQRQREFRWRDVWRMFDSLAADEFFAVPWYNGYDTALPGDASLEDISRCGEAFARIAQSRDVSLAAVRSRVVRAGVFNALLARHGNKAEVLSRLTLELVAEMLAPLPPAHVLIHCDKHGGRNCYAALLQETFPEHLVEIYGEARAQSVYRWGPGDARTEIRFVAGGESALPTALASMTAKYLRELAMQAFNDFWLREVPGIRPTAGYPGDARRFHQEIAARQAELGIDDDTLWRRR